MLLENCFLGSRYLGTIIFVVGGSLKQIDAYRYRYERINTPMIIVQCTYFTSPSLFRD